MSDVVEFVINEAFKDFFYDTHEIVTLWGGRNSGKSYAAAQKIIYRMLTEVPHLFLVIHKFERKIKSTVFAQLLEVIKNEGLEDEFTSTTTPMEIRCTINDNKIIFFGLDGGKIKSTTGLTGVWIEESTWITEDDWRELHLSVRGEHANYIQFILSYNPIDARHWINLRFHIEKTYDAHLYFSTYLDNPFGGKDYEKKLDANKHDQSYYRMAKFGIWGTISEATVFRKWIVYDEKEHKDIPTKIEDFDKVSAGLDWGFTHVSCCLVAGILNDTLVILDEIYVKGKTNPEFMALIKEKDYGKSFTYFADSAEPARIKEFRQSGFNIAGVKKGKGSVKFAIDFLKRFNIIIMPHCKNTIREISTYSYEVDKKTEQIFDVPALKQDDDSIASLRYLVNPFLPRKSVGGLKAVQRL